MTRLKKACCSFGQVPKVDKSEGILVNSRLQHHRPPHLYAKVGLSTGLPLCSMFFATSLSEDRILSPGKLCRRNAEPFHMDFSHATSQIPSSQKAVGVLRSNSAFHLHAKLNGFAPLEKPSTYSCNADI